MHNQIDIDKKFSLFVLNSYFPASKKMQNYEFRSSGYLGMSFFTSLLYDVEFNELIIEHLIENKLIQKNQSYIIKFWRVPLGTKLTDNLKTTIVFGVVNQPKNLTIEINLFFINKIIEKLNAKYCK